MVASPVAIVARLRSLSLQDSGHCRCNTLVAVAGRLRLLSLKIFVSGHSGHSYDKTHMPERDVCSLLVLCGYWLNYILWRLSG